MNLKEKYENLCNSPSDINEHLPTLKRYTEECDHVTEMGVRWVVSTFAFLMGQPKKLVSIDIATPESFGGVSVDAITSVAQENGTAFEFILGDTREVEIEETDLLFIDTRHDYDQLRDELARHGEKVRKYIAFHDTTLFEWSGETAGCEGLWPAIEEFLAMNEHWVIHERFTNNNGLTVLKRVSE